MSSRGASQERMPSQERETPFAGYGDRVGSGVAYAPAQWRGGEIVTDPALLTKSLKPRSIYYSPIGHGVVAADGVELKRLPPDLTPKVEVIQQRVVEKGDRGHAGIRVTEKTWSTGGPRDDLLKGHGHTEGPGAGPPAAGAGAAPRAPEADPFAGLADQLGPAAPAARPASAQSAPAPIRNGYGDGAGDAGLPKDWGKAPAAAPAAAAPAAAPKDAGPYGAGPPYGGPSTRSTPLDFGGAKSPATANGLGPVHINEYPPSGRSSASLYEPGMRYEIQKAYRVTNPRELIHQYATGTPVTVIDPSLETTQRTITRQHYTQTVEESYGPYPPYTSPPNVPSPLKFARQLRDETMTDSQRQANRQQQSMGATSRDSNFEQRIEDLRRSTSRMSSNDPVMADLTSRLSQGLK